MRVHPPSNVHLTGEMLVISVCCQRGIATIAALAVVLLGCSKQPVGPPRGTVHGKITLDGKPIATGMINFKPMGPAAGPTCGLPLKDGQYASDAKGPIVGKNRIEIRARSQTPTQPQNPDGDWKSNYIEAIPARYNSQSVLEADVRPGDNTFDFELNLQ
jgi:hypothetical protein